MGQAKRVVFVFIALGAAVTALALRVQANDSPPPERPPWMNADGTIDVQKAPDKIALLDCRGEIVGYKDFRKELEREMNAPSREGPRINGEGAYTPPCDESRLKPVIKERWAPPPTDAEEIERLRER